MKYDGTYQYIASWGEEIKSRPDMVKDMGRLLDERVPNKSSVLEFISDDALICLMMKQGEIVGFSWVEFSESVRQDAELSWFATSPTEVSGLDGKNLLDFTLEKCKQLDVKNIRFNCFDQSWGRIQDKNKLLKRFGYNVTDSKDSGFDVSIEI